MIPFFETGGERWFRQYSQENGLDVARGYIDFFEPDVLVESAPGMAEKLGWSIDEAYIKPPRAISIEKIYKADRNNLSQFAVGIDVLDVMAELYQSEFKFERRHKQHFAKIQEAPGDAYFDVVVGRYPEDAPLQYLARTYEEVFSPEALLPDVSTAVSHVKDGLLGPLWLTQHKLEENFGRGGRDQTFYLFDSKDPGDVIDYWNYRLIARNLIPINVNWIAELSPLIREHITAVHRPIPGNPFGTYFHSGICIASSIGDEHKRDLLNEYLSDLPVGSFYTYRDLLPWQERGRGRDRHERKILATGKAVSFNEEVKPEASVKIPAPSPSFVNCTQQYKESSWVNIIVPAESYRSDSPATVYPTNLWSPAYPQLAFGRRFRVGREGWIVQIEHDIGYTLLSLERGRDAIIGWFKAQGVEATPSEEGQIAAQVISAAGGLLSSGMFADQETLKLLNEMAESHSEVSRGGKKTTKSVPGRSKHFNSISEHFVKRSKRSFGYWNSLDHFLKSSVFRAGVQVKCPICGYANWMDLNELSYRPTCKQCLNEFAFSQMPEQLREVKWFYRVVGPFAAPDFARGAYSVALTLRALSGNHRTELTWSTGLSLSIGFELDFVVWRRRTSGLQDECDDPLLVIGEAKSFGRNSITDDVIKSLMTVAERFRGTVMVVSVMREAVRLSLAEIGRMRRLASWGRRESHQGEPINPLIILTGTELFADRSIEASWAEVDGSRVDRSSDFQDLHELSELTIQRYLGLGRYGDKQASTKSTEEIAKLLGLLQSRVVYLSARTDVNST